MTDRDALYRAVLDNPDDDTLRLVYADALEESGDPCRAAFVRTRVGVSRAPEYDPVAVRARNRESTRAAGEQWIAELPPLPNGLDWVRSDPFRRGLPGAIQARNGTAFGAHAETLFSQYPIESLDLALGRREDAEALAACPWLNRIRHLSLAPGASGRAVAVLLNSPHLERLTELHLSSHLTTAPAVTAVVRSRAFARLTGLSVREDRPGSGSLVDALALLNDPPRLKRLDLSGNHHTTESLYPLFTSPVMTAVETLELSGNNLGASGLTALAAILLSKLRTLRALGTDSTDTTEPRTRR